MENSQNIFSLLLRIQGDPSRTQPVKFSINSFSVKIILVLALVLAEDFIGRHTLLLSEEHPDTPLTKRSLLLGFVPCMTPIVWDQIDGLEICFCLLGRCQFW